MRNCFCYEDLDAKKRNTELNDSYLAASSPQRFDYPWRNKENDSHGNIQSSDLEKSNKLEPKKDSIRSTSTVPDVSMDKVQISLQRLKTMRDQGLIDEDE